MNIFSSHLRSYLQKKRFPVRNTVFIVTLSVICIPLMLLVVFSLEISGSTIIETVKTDSLANMSTIEHSFGLMINIIESSLLKQSQVLEKNAELFEDTRWFSRFEEQVLSDCEYVNKVSLVSTGAKAFISNDEHLNSSGIFFSSAMVDAMKNIVEGYTLADSICEKKQINYYNSKNQIFVTKPHYVSAEKKEVLVFNFSLLHPIKNPLTHTVKGFLIYSINPQIFAELFLPISNLKNCDFFILDPSFGVMASLDPQYISSSFYSISGVSQINFEKSNSGVHLYDKKPTIFTSKKTHVLDLTFIILTPYEYVEFFLNYNQQKLIFIFISGVGFSVFASAILSKQITKPITNLQKNLNLFSRGELQIKSTAFGNNEFTDLANSFNNMTDQISRLIKSLDLEEATVENYKFRLTQAQINPHFLYNVLELISSLINLDMYREAESAAVKLSQFYRTALSDGVDIVPLKTEYINLKNYLDLQRMRYIEYFDFNIDVSPETLGCSIPKMTLQPLAENAIYHGIRHSKRKGLLEISVFIKSGRLCLIVRDNGVGISKEKISELMADSTGTIITRNFGVSSVIHRLNYYFSNQAKLKIESTENEYTAITISVPVIKYQDGEEMKPYEKNQSRPY